MEFKIRGQFLYKKSPAFQRTNAGDKSLLENVKSRQSYR